MRKTLLLVLLATATAACAYRPPPSPFSPDAFDDALAVRLLPPEGGFLRFVTTAPAHVAVFEIAPDRGVSLLYPQFREESARVSRVGANAEFLPWRAQGRWFYASTPFYPSFAALSRPTYLYIIASKSPLRVEDIRLQPARLRAAMGWRSFLASDLSGTLDDLERLVVPEIAGDDWSSDLYIVWPEVPLNQPWQTRYVFINCPDGRTVVVPLGWNIDACPGARNLAQATKPTTPDSPPGTIPETDSTGIPLTPPSGPADATPRQPVAPPAVGLMPRDEATITRLRFDGAVPARQAPTRAADAPPPPRAEAPRPAPAPRPDPAPKVEAVRSEPRPPSPAPREPADPKEPAKP